jgi:hypothetical protein
MPSARTQRTLHLPVVRNEWLNKRRKLNQNTRAKGRGPPIAVTCVAAFFGCKLFVYKVEIMLWIYSYFVAHVRGHTWTVLYERRYSWRSQWPRGLRRGSAVARLLGFCVRITSDAWMSVSCECCVLSGRCLCVGLITHPEESYRVWCVSECDLEASITKRPSPTRDVALIEEMLQIIVAF